MTPRCREKWLGMYLVPSSPRMLELEIWWIQSREKEATFFLYSVQNLFTELTSLLEDWGGAKPTRIEAGWAMAS